MDTFSFTSIPMEYFKDFVEKCPAEMLKHILYHGPKRYVSEIIRYRPKFIRHIDPKIMTWLTDHKIEQLNQIAVTSSYWTIVHIKDPSEKVQMIVIKQDFNRIKDIKNPTLKVQRLAMKIWHEKKQANPNEPDPNGNYNVSYGGDWDVPVRITIYDNPKPRMEFLQFMATHYSKWFFKPYNFSVSNTKKKDEDIFPWDRVPAQFQEWLIKQDLNNISKIPANKLLPRLRKKYKFAISLKRANIL